MFKLNPAPQFTAPVSLTVAGQDAPATISVVFVHRGKQALADWTEAARDPAKTDLAALSEVVVGWDGVGDDAGNAVPFSAAALASLLDQYPPAAGELFAAYFKGLTESRVKN